MASPISYLTAKVQTIVRLAPYFGRALRLVHEASGWRTSLWVLLLLAQGVLPTVTISLTRLLVDAIVDLVNASGDIGPPLFLAGMIGLLMLVGEGLRVAASWLFTAQSELVRDHIRDLIHQQSTAVDIAYYESPEYHDHLHRARDASYYRPMMLMESAGQLFQGGVTLLAIMALLVPYSPWLPLILLVSALPALYLALRLRLREHLWRLGATADKRKAWYCDWLLTASETAAEVRTLALGEHFRKRYRDLRGRLRREYLELSWAQSLAELVSMMFGFVVSGALMLWMLWRVIQGAMTLGDLTLFYRVLDQGQRTLRGMLQHIGQLYASSLFLSNFYEFLELEPQVIDPVKPVSIENASPGIQFQNVTFRYPNADQTILRNFNLTVPAGKFVAIVGANGSGKSTLVKLMCRLYDPESGAVTLGGVDLRDMATSDLRRNVAVLFQDPVHYSATVAENIALGDLAADDTRIPYAAQLAGASEIIEDLPGEYDTLLGKWFEGGTELSNGEWQRVALARVLMRPAPVVLLDEPTSAMDPWAEVDWIEQFRQSTRGRTVVLITHRFTAVTGADLIYVMDRGKIVESGTHRHLVSYNGRYASLWMQHHNGQQPVMGTSPQP